MLERGVVIAGQHTEDFLNKANRMAIIAIAPPLTKLIPRRGTSDMIPKLVGCSGVSVNNREVKTRGSKGRFSGYESQGAAA